MVYCRSEALKYGLPLEEVLDIIMDSNESKLDANGKPIYDANGKFLKGPELLEAGTEDQGVAGSARRQDGALGACRFWEGESWTT